MAKRLVRTRQEVGDSAEVINLPASENFMIRTKKGGNIDVDWLRDTDLGSEIVTVLNNVLSDQRAQRALANGYILYLQHIVQNKMDVGIQSLKSYKQELDRTPSIKLNTKNQRFSLALNLVKRLMSENILPMADLPGNFSREAPVYKASFAEACKCELPLLLRSHAEEVSLSEIEYKLEKQQAEGLVFSRRCMNNIEKIATEKVNEIIRDWRFVDSVIEQLSRAQLSKLRAIDNFSEDCMGHTLELAIGVLHAKYGYALPPSAAWPKGLTDFCKYRKWLPKRIQGAFFPVAKTLDSFIVLALANKHLMPNVSSVTSYAYIDCVRKGHDRGSRVVCFGKKRGGGATASLGKKESLVIALDELSSRIKKILPWMPKGNEILSKEKVPLMLHYTASAGREATVRTLDESSPSYMVRRFIKQAALIEAELEPLIGKVSGENFRPTHAYISRLSGDSMYQLKQRLHHKSLTTTEHYVSGVDTQALLSRKQKDFMNYLIKNARSEGMKRTGSGYYCDQATAIDAKCTNYENCHNCKARRIVFSSPVLAAEWIAWEKHIEINKNRLIMNNEDRWNRIWGPKLIECKSYIALETKRTLKEADQIACTIVLPPID